MRVNRKLCALIEVVLYAHVNLSWGPQVLLFYRSIRSCPRRAELVTEISFLASETRDEHLFDVFASLLGSLRNVQHLTLEQNREVVAGPPLTAIAGVHLPQLRSFTADIRVEEKVLLDFVSAHDKLRELDLRYTFVIRDPSQHSVTIPHPSLKILTSRTPQLNSRAPAAPNLTHLYRPYLLIGQLDGIVSLLGPQLVSLRLGHSFPIEPFQPWSLQDVVSNFPRLRFFIVGMFHVGGFIIKQ